MHLYSYAMSFTMKHVVLYGYILFGCGCLNLLQLPVLASKYYASEELEKCSPRLRPRVWRRYCGHLTSCENDKFCSKPGEICLCDSNCGKHCGKRGSDSCTPTTCQNGGTCSLIGNPSNQTVSCNCKPGWSGDRCENDIDECQPQSPCVNGGSCINTGGSYHCNCISEWTGPNCSINRDDCIGHKCSSGSTCIDLVGTYECKCPPSKTGIHCQFVDECRRTDPCGPNAICSTNSSGHAACNCMPGFTGANCSIDFDECNSSRSPCELNGVCHNIPGSYKCVCKPGYTGERCGDSIDECIPNPCVNGQCIDYVALYTCVCPPGYTGKLCETNINECEPQPCLNQGQCRDGINKYECACRIGYNGTNCESNINDCVGNQCDHESTCIDDIANYSCKCKPGYIGKFCETEIDDCDPNPCVKGTCIDQINGYKCSCFPGSTGVNCSSDILECLSNPCKNGGTCDELQGSYRCNCPSGFSGKDCEIDRNECLSVPCSHGGTCIDGNNAFTCVCPFGYTGEQCQYNVNECLSNPCNNGGTCFDEIAHFRCACPAGYTGKRCESSDDNCIQNQCYNGATCISTSVGYKCQCKAGYSGAYCENNINDCQADPCQHGTCIDLENSHYCRCDGGYTGVNCSLDKDDCFVGACFNGGLCIDATDSFQCNCQSGFTGARCELQVNECSTLPCKNGGTCRDGLNDYACACPYGYTGKNCEQLVDWCNGQNICKNGASCYQQGTSFQCTCTAGWIGGVCDIWAQSCSQAKPNVCNNGTCINTPAGHNCRCHAGYKGSFCTENVDECASNPCYNGGACNDLINGYSCTCQKGFSGAQCKLDLDDCASKPCINGNCIDVLNGYICRCNRGFEGLNCEVNHDDCHYGACYNKGNCTDRIGSYECSCEEGFGGARCEQDVNECQQSLCHAYGTETCINTPGSYECICKDGFTGDHCQINVDECSTMPCENDGICKDGANMFTCLCPRGYSGKNCSNIVQTCNDKPCLNSGICRTSANGYSCDCQAEFKGFHCEYDIDFCAASPCVHGNCVERTDDYLCSCIKGYTGKNCDINIDDCSTNPCFNGGTCIDEVGGYTCVCPDDYKGEVCQIYDSVNATCPYRDCSKTFDGGQCQEKCNNRACNWDGTDCSFGVDPWANCTAAGFQCWNQFKNKKCDPMCNSAICLYDGFDCLQTKPKCKYETYCRDVYGNGRCESACNNEECGFDAYDCQNTVTAKQLPGSIQMILLTDANEFKRRSLLFLRELSIELNAHVFVLKRSDGSEMIEDVDDVVIERKRRDTETLFNERTRRASDAKNVKIDLGVDVGQCQSSCWKDTGSAASYIAALQSKGQLQTSLPIYTVKGNDKANGFGEPDGKDGLDPLWIAVLCVVIPAVIFSVVVGVKRVISSTLWVPAGFDLTQVRSRRQQPRNERCDPDGQVISMSSLNKNHDRHSPADIEHVSSASSASPRESWPPTDDSDSPSSIRDHKRLRVDLTDAPNDGSKDLLDNRQWTTLHREAADSRQLGLTPPQQNTLDSKPHDVDVCGPGGLTALHVASCRRNTLEPGYDDDKDSDDSGDGAMVSSLLTVGASHSAKTDVQLETPLHLAARHSNAIAAKRLLDSGADANARDSNGRTPLHLAVSADAPEVFQVLVRNRATQLDAMARDGSTPLMDAARFCINAMLKELINTGVKVNIIDSQGRSALHWSVSVNNIEATIVLLQNSAKVDVQDQKGQTPLFLAAREGNFESARVLLQNFANRNIADNMDQSPIQIAREKGHKAIENLLADWTLGSSPQQKVPGPVSPEARKSPPGVLSHHHTNGSPRSSVSPPTVEIRPRVNNIAPRMYPNQQLTSDKECPKSANKRRRKSSGRGASAACGRYISSDSLSMNPHVNHDIRHSHPHGHTTLSPTLSPPYNQMPPHTMMMDGKSAHHYCSTDQMTGNQLPELTDSDIMEGIFAAEKCFRDVPPEWGDNTFLGSSGIASANTFSNPLSTSCALPNTTIGMQDSIRGHDLASVNQMRANRLSLRDSYNLSNNDHYAPESMPLLPSQATYNFNAGRGNTHAINDRLNSHKHYQQYEQQNVHHTFAQNAMLQQLQHQQQQQQQQHHQQQPQHHFPTPPSAHSGNYMSPSSETAVSPLERTASSFLTPSPDSAPNQSPGGWSSSPHSNSESSSC